MSASRTVPDGCRRFQAAVADGRFLEDPVVWQPHVDACEPCRAIAEGLFALRAGIEETRSQLPLPPPAAEGASAVMETAFARVERRRQRFRFGACGVAVLLLLGAALWAATRRSEGPPPDAEAYAVRLGNRLKPTGTSTLQDRFAEDPDLDGACRAALDHPSSLVRRTAVWGLAMGGQPIDAAELTRILDTWDESLEGSIEVAFTGDAVRRLRERLDAQRTATLGAVLLAAYVQGSRGEATPPAAALTPFLVHAEPSVRERAVAALSVAQGGAAWDALERVLRADPDVAVRCAAGRALLEATDAPAARVIDYVSTARNYDLERCLAVHLRPHDAAARLAETRLADPATPRALAVLYLETLCGRDASRRPTEAFFASVLAAPGEQAAEQFVRVAQRHGWVEYREALQACCRGMPPGPARDRLAAALERWGEALERKR